MQGSSHQVIPIFDGEKYDFWSIKMKTILKTRKLWSVVGEGVPDAPVAGEETPETRVARTQREEAMANDTMALQILQTAVTDQIFSRIAAANTSKEAWDALKSEYEGSPQVRMIKLQALRREYENLKMYDGEDLKSFTDKLIVLENQLTYHGDKKTNSQIVQKILISLPAKFDSVVSVLEQTRDLETLTMTELIGILKAHEARLSARDESTKEGAFNARTKERKFGFKQVDTKSRGIQGNKWCEYCRRSNHTNEECWKKPEENDKSKNNKSNIKCYNCGNIGHYSHECRLKKKEKAHVSIEEEENLSDEDHMLFSASEVAATTTRKDIWLVDSGCTNHMTKEERYFSKIDKSIKVPITLGNGEIVMTAGKGDITIMTSNGKKVIKNVFLVPGLKKNLLSIPQIISRGYQVCFKYRRCIILDTNGKKIMEIPMTQKSFIIKLTSVLEEAKKDVEEIHERQETEKVIQITKEDVKKDSHKRCLSDMMVIKEDTKQERVTQMTEEDVKKDSRRKCLSDMMVIKEDTKQERVTQMTEEDVKKDSRRKCLSDKMVIKERHQEKKDFAYLREEGSKRRLKRITEEDVMKIHAKHKTGTGLAAPKKRQRFSEENSLVKRKKKSTKPVSAIASTTRVIKREKSITVLKKSPHVGETKPNRIGLKSLIANAKQKIQEKRQHKENNHEASNIKRKRIDARLALNKVVPTVAFDDHLKYHSELEQLGYTFIHDEVECLNKFSLLSRDDFNDESKYTVLKRKKPPWRNEDSTGKNLKRKLEVKPKLN